MVLRLALAPVLVAAATLAARRWGAPAGGWVASLPVVAGPILLVLAADHGPAFGAQAATAATLGLVSLAAFTTVYALAAVRGAPWPICLVLGWGAFLATTGVLSLVPLPAAPAFLLALVVFRLCRLPLDERSPPALVARRLPADIPMRMGAALLMVVGLGAVSGILGPRLSGLLTPFPIIGSVMAAFTHITLGARAVPGYSSALLRGLPSFALFTALVGLSLVPLGPVSSFLSAAGLAVVSHGLLIAWSRRAIGPWPTAARA
jgi:hypothetical protein